MPQATKATQKQLAYLAYWQQRGYSFGPNDVIPESTEILPDQWSMPRWVDLAFTAIALLAVCAALYLKV